MKEIHLRVKLHDSRGSRKATKSSLYPRGILPRLVGQRSASQKVQR
jgi:hypothetical protein